VNVDNLNINESLEYAWRYTNNVDGSWSLKLGSDASHNVEVIGNLPVIDGKEFGIRSSSIGDIFIIGEDEYMVDIIGFKKLEDPVVNKQAFNP
jgi:hypothetical protein